jgi:hypothetical protein
MMTALHNKNFRNLISPGSLVACVTLVSITLIYFLPFFDARNYFIGDDFVWLYQAQVGRFLPTLGADDYSYQNKYGAWAFLYHLIPLSIYNDRPGGFLVIKIIYEIFGMNSASPYYVVSLLFHVLNVVLFYKYVRLFLSRWPAWIAAALSATWFYANDGATRINAIFDVVAFTAALISMLLFRSSIEEKNKTKYVFAVLFFIFAVRSKEYAIGLLPIIFLQELMFFKANLRDILRRISGYLFVFFLIISRYLWLYFDKASEKLVGSASNYRLTYGFQSIFENLYWYLSEVFYRPFVSPIWLGLILLVFATIFLIGDVKLKKIYIYSLCSFALLLGPVLLFAGQRSSLYLYAPHFFIAFILAAALEGKVFNKILGVLLISFVSIIPFSSNWRHDSTEWMLARRGEVREQLKSGLPMIVDRFNKENGDLVIYVSGVKPYISAYVNAWAILSYLHKPVKNLSENVLYVLGQHTTESKEDFYRKFCSRNRGKLFIEYVNDVAYDRTQDFEKKCE